MYWVVCSCCSFFNFQKAAKFDKEQAEKVFEWIVFITGDENAKPESYMERDIQEILKDGVILCK